MNSKDILKYDLYRYGIEPKFTGYLKGFLIPGFRFTVFLRLSRKYKKSNIFGLISRIFLRHYSFKFGIQIPAQTNIGKGFYIGHFGQIVINGRCKIGENCNISPGVTIGQSSRGKYKGYPTISNNVWIGTNAVIVGNVKIGENVLIAPLTFVNFNVPPNSIVIGNPGKIIHKENATEKYIINILSEQYD